MKIKSKMTPGGGFGGVLGWEFRMFSGFSEKNWYFLSPRLFKDWSPERGLPLRLHSGSEQTSPCGDVCISPTCHCEEAQLPKQS